jgi:hypothetical protein
MAKTRVTLAITDYEMKQHARGRAQTPQKIDAALKKLAVDRVKAEFDQDVFDQDIRFDREDDGWRYSVEVVTKAEAPADKAPAAKAAPPAKKEDEKPKAPAKPKIIEKKKPAKAAKKKAPAKKTGA